MLSWLRDALEARRAVPAGGPVVEVVLAAFVDAMHRGLGVGHRGRARPGSRVVNQRPSDSAVSGSGVRASGTSESSFCSAIRVTDSRQGRHQRFSTARGSLSYAMSVASMTIILSPERSGSTTCVTRIPDEVRSSLIESEKPGYRDLDCASSTKSPAVSSRNAASTPSGVPSLTTSPSDHARVCICAAGPRVSWRSAMRRSCRSVAMTAKAVIPPDEESNEAHWGRAATTTHCRSGPWPGP